MALTEAQKRANAKYVKKAYEDIRLRVKPEKRPKLKPERRKQARA